MSKQFEYKIGSFVNFKHDGQVNLGRVENVKHDEGGTICSITVNDGKLIYDVVLNDIISVVDLEGLNSAKFTANHLKEGDAVNHPPHYNDGKIEVIDYINDKKMNFNRGNVIKYVSRAGKKASKGLDDLAKEIQDLEKAAFYLNDEIKRLKKELEERN